MVLDQREDRSLVVEVDAVMEGEIRSRAVHRAGVQIKVPE
jgi:hypothetical protein